MNSFFESSLLESPEDSPSPYMDYDMKGSSSYPSTVHDWMINIRRPVPYRVGNARLHLKPRLVAYVAIFASALLILLVMFLPSPGTLALKCPDYDLRGRPQHAQDALAAAFPGGNPYNSTYPLSKPVLTDKGMKFPFAMITDLDTNSKSKFQKNTWVSFMKFGNLTLSGDWMSVEFETGPSALTLTSSLSAGGRGMELSELVTFDGKLYTVDDRTGVIYLIRNEQVIPWVILTDGNGIISNKGFKCEWACVKDEKLYVGSLGKEWTSRTGVVQNLNPQWVKVIDRTGAVTHIDWHENYNALRKKTGTLLPGYLIHESAVWSTVHQRWFFLPRRLSEQAYDETADERRATNVLLSCNERFGQIKVTRIGVVNPTHGYSTFKFVPGTQDTVIIALKSEEDDGNIASYIQAFNINGHVLLSETKIGNQKFEGIEFI